MLRYDLGIKLYRESGFLCNQCLSSRIYPWNTVSVAVPGNIATPGYLAWLLFSGEVFRH